MHVIVIMLQTSLSRSHDKKWNQLATIQKPTNCLTAQTKPLVCKPAYLVPIPSQDKLEGLQQEGHPAQKWGDDGGGLLISSDGVAPIQTVGVSASVMFP